MSESFDEFQPASSEWDEFAPANGPSNKAVALAAVRANPDQASEAAKLAKKYDLDNEVLLRNLQDVKVRDAVNTVAEKLGASPKMADYMRNRPFAAKQSHDDLDALAQVESSVGALSLSSVAQGVLGMSESIWRIPDAAQRAVGYVAGVVEKTGLSPNLNPIRGVQDVLQLLSEGQLPIGPKLFDGTTDVANRVNNAQDLLTKDTAAFGTSFADLQTLSKNADTALKTAVTTGDVGQLGQVITDPKQWVSAIGSAAPSLVTSMMSGGSLAFMGAMEALEQANNAAEFEQRTGTKISDGEFTQAVAQTALINSFLEKAGLDKVLGAQGKGLSGILRAVAGEGGTEALQQINSNLAALLTYDEGKSLLEGVLSSFMGGAGSGGAAATVSSAGNALQKSMNARQQQNDGAQQSAERLQAAFQAAASSKLRERNPETFQQLVQALAEQTDGAPQSVFIDAQVLAQSGVDIATVLPSVADQMEGALATNSMVEVSIAEAMTNLPGTPLEQVFLQNARATEASPSLIEAQQGAEQGAQYIKQEADRVLAQAQDRDAWQQSGEKVKTAILQDLNTAGKFDPEANEVKATLASRMISVMAHSAGMTPEELFAKYPLRTVAGGAQRGAQELDQITPEQAMQTNVPVEMPTVPEFTEAVGNTPGAQVTENGLLLDLVRFQKPEQEGAQAIRTGVFYLPVKSTNAKHYKTSPSSKSAPNPYGGTERMEGPTLIRRPLFVKGATGGKAPEAAYDAVKGKGAMKVLDKAVVDVVTSRGFMTRIDPDSFRMKVEQFLGDFGGERGLAREIIENSKVGNTLRYALQEHVIAHAVREAGYDAVVGYSKGKAGANISEVFDVRELTFPARGAESEIADQFLNQSATSSTPIGDATEVDVDGTMRPALNSNGQPIAGTVEAVQNFWRWFGDSRVVDTEGRPLVYYRATDSDRTEFRKSWRGGLIYFAASAEGAERATRAGNAATYPVYLKAENIRGRKGPGVYYGDAEAKGYEDKLVKGGFDAVKVRDEASRYGGTLAVLNPTQIKSATGNSGDFSPTDANILRQGSQRFSEDNRLSNLNPNGASWQRIRESNPTLVGKGPDDTVTVYRATVGDTIRPDDFVAVDKSTLRKELENVRERDGKGAKIIEQQVRVRDLLMGNDATEFVYFPEQADAFEQGPRGTFNPQTFLLTLNENANLTTFEHELGHFALEVMADLASQPNLPARIAEDMDKLLKWFGITGDEQVGGTDSGVPLAQGVVTQEVDDALDALTSDDLEDDQVFSRPLPAADDESIGYLSKIGASAVGSGGVQLSVRGGEVREAGPHEFFFHDNNDEPVGFARLTKNGKQASINMIAFTEDARGNGYGKAFYKYLLDDLGVEVKSDKGITEGTAALYRSLANAYSARVDPDGRVVVSPKPATLAQDGNLPVDNTRPAGRTPLEVWNSMTLDQKRPHHEKLAESFEQYLLEGKAPSVDLQPVFRRLRSWFVAAYKSLTDFMAGRNLQLSDEIRQVFDRLLATDEQIAEAERTAGMLPDFEATNEAIEKLQSRSLRDLKWTIGARSKAIKALQKQAASLRKGITEEVTAEVMQMPEMRTKAALDALRKDSKRTPTDVEMATIADSFGYAGVDEMLSAIDAFGKAKDVIEGMTDQRMLERHGDLIDQRAIEQAANEAVHNEARARSLAAELKAQADALNPREDTGRTASNGRSITVNALVEAAKQFAENLTARRKLKDLKSAANQHRAAEARAAKRWQEATAKGQTQEAVNAKRDQMLNNYAAKGAMEAQAEVRKIVEFFRKVATGNNETMVDKGRDPDVVNAMRAILATYGVRPSMEKGALEYLAVLQANDPAMYAALQPSIAGAMNNAKGLDEMTVEELRGLNDEIKAMWYLAKRSRQMEVDGNLLDIDDAAQELQDRMQAIGVPAVMPGDSGAITNAQKRARWLQHAGSLLRRAEQWAEGMDGKWGGPFLRLVFQPVKEAANRYRADRTEYRKAYQALVDKVAPALAKGKIAAPELGYTFGEGHNGIGHAELLHAILHTGNESNKRKLLLGRKWATENADGTLDTQRWDAFIQRMHDTGVLTQVHYDFAQGVWDLLEKTKPLAQKTHRDVFGRYFAEITADSFETPFGTYRGGYVPAQADPRIVQDAEVRKLAEAENENMAYSFPSTNKGFTKGRVEYNRPLLLDLRTIGQHLDKVLLFAHMEPAVRDVQKLLTQKGVAYSLGRIDPTIVAGMLTPWLNRSARQIVETPILGDGGISRVLSAVRARAGMTLMFANVSNSLQQLSGFGNAFAKLKADNLESHMMRATAQFIASPKEMARSVAAASPFMEGRMENEIAAINDAMDAILLDPNLYEKAQAWTSKHAYFMQTAIANTMEPIIWTAGYNGALQKGMSEKDAARYADALVRQTQGSTLPEDVSRIETGPAYGRIFTQFIGYFNMMANTNATALKQIADDVGLKKGAGKALLVVTAGMLIPLWVAEAIAQAMRGGPDDEDDDGYLDDWLAAVFGMGTIKGAFAMVPFVGQFANVAINKMNGNPADDRASLSPAVSMLEAGAGVPKLVYQAATDPDKINARNAVRDVASAISIATGLPAYAVARPVGYLAAVADDRVAPTSAVDAARGVVTGTASPESKQR